MIPLVALAALIIAIFSLVVSYLTYRRDRPAVGLRMREQDGDLAIIVHSGGRQPVSITRVYLRNWQLPLIERGWYAARAALTRKRVIYTSSSGQEVNPQDPVADVVALEPGDSTSPFRFRGSEVRELFAPGRRAWAVVEFVTGDEFRAEVRRDWFQSARPVT